MPGAAPARRSTRLFGPYPGPGLLGAGTMSAVLTALVLPFVRPGQRPYVALGGLAVGAALNVLGLLLRPGPAPTGLTRLRWAFDGMSMGLSLSFVAWLLVTPTHGAPPVALAALLVASSGLAITALTVLRAAWPWPAALFSGAGAGLGLAGLATLTVALAGSAPVAGTAPVAGSAPAAALVTAAAALLAAPVLVWYGARSSVGRSAPAGAAVGSFSATHPLLTLPVALAAVAAVYHTATVGKLDGTSLRLGVTVAAVATTREMLASIDVRRNTRRLVTREAHFRSLVANCSDVTLVVGTDLVVRWQSPAAVRQFGLADRDVLGHALADLVHPDDGAVVEQRLRHVLAVAPAEPGRPTLVEARLRDGLGCWRDTESTVSDLRATPEVSALVLHVRDVGERKRLERERLERERLERERLERTLGPPASTDQLTGLPGRPEWRRAVAALRGLPGATGAILVIELRGVELGGQVGAAAVDREMAEALLVEAARRLRAGIGQDDMAARLGETEFGVVTAERPLEAYGLGVRLLKALTEAYRLPGATMHRTASIGLAEVTVRDSIDEIVHRAVLACRRAQQLGGERVEWYDGSLEALLLRRETLERSLPGAAGRGEMDVVYQPIVDLLDGRPVGVEALLRWRHPVLGTILPGEVIPIAKQVGATGEVGGWVVQTVCRQLGGWLREGRDIWVSVNVSVARLASYGFLAKVTGALKKHGVPADRLTVEVTESGIGAQIGRVATQLGRLRALGVRTALDHFGAARNSLAHLRQLPLDYLKIDGSLFLTPPAGGAEAPLAPLMDVVVGLGRRLGVQIVVGGLESEDQLELVRAAGCRYGQGFLFGRPVPAEHIEAYLESYRTPSS